jgi:hypothetical protein
MDYVTQQESTLPPIIHPSIIHWKPSMINSVGECTMTKLPSLYLRVIYLVHHAPFISHYLSSYTYVLKVHSHLVLEHPHQWCSVCNPTTQNWTRWGFRYVGTTNNKPPGAIIMIGQSKTGNSSQVVFITLFCVAGAQFCCDCYQPQLNELSTYAGGRNIIFLSHTGICWLVFIRF